MVNAEGVVLDNRVPLPHTVAVDRPMLKTVFLVPEADNQGVAFGRRLLDELDQRLLAFGGYQRQTGIEGAWIGVARTYRDPCRLITVSLTTVRQFPQWLDAVEWVLIAFGQEAVYLEVNGSPEILAAPVKDSSPAGEAATST
jgi:hypothetical protein